MCSNPEILEFNDVTYNGLFKGEIDLIFFAFQPGTFTSLNADVIISFSTTDGFTSYRDEEAGTWYIKSMCKVFNKHSKTMHLLDILTETGRNVVTKYENVQGNVVLKQAPEVGSPNLKCCINSIFQILSRLTKQWHFSRSM